MSIYLVQLSTWFKEGDENYETCRTIVDISRCLACRSKLKWKNVIAYHALPWGYSSDTWCSWECYDSGKKAKPDKRRERSLKRRYGIKTESRSVQLAKFVSNENQS